MPATDRLIDAYVDVFGGQSGDLVLADLLDAYVYRTDSGADGILAAQGYKGAELAVARDAQRLLVITLRDIVQRPDHYKRVFHERSTERSN